MLNWEYAVVLLVSVVAHVNTKHLQLKIWVYVASVNFVPQYSTEGCHLFAIIALGENKIPDASFFASVHQKEYGTSINEQSEQQEGQYISNHLSSDENSDVNSEPL